MPLSLLSGNVPYFIYIASNHFPCFMRVSWRSPISSRRSFHHDRFFLAHRLNDLVFGSIDALAHLCIFSNLAVSCPFLTRTIIAVTFPDFQPLAIPSISQVVRALTRLESLVVPGLDERALVHVAHLPDLNLLRLESHVPCTFFPHMHIFPSAP